MAESRTSVHSAKVIKECAPATTFQARVAVIKEVLAATMIQASFRGWAVRNKRAHIVKKLERRSSKGVAKKFRLSPLGGKMKALAHICTPRAPHLAAQPIVSP